ncbi:MAG TPA: (d)CMP kinase [Thermomicrobiaceae bacterium]|nr:(d)CMP kinase [Thermomicrobiaceae bacterium]
MGATSGAADHLVVAIDGPAAAGKTTVASAAARRLDALYFDTGVIYRALTLAALERGVPPADALRLAGLARHLKIEVRPPSRADGRLYDVWLEGRDVTWDVRSTDVDRAVSEVSAHPAVRRELLGIQRRIGRSGRVVLTGRDVGTAVLPEANVKIWLDASLDERARRRQAELALRGTERDLAVVRAEMADRDRLDATRSSAPMAPAADAVRLDTDGLTVDEVVERIVELAEAAERGRVHG